jgi:hypothetical protein
LILNNFKKLVAFSFCCPFSISDGDDSGYPQSRHNLPYRTKYFKTWDNELTSITLYSEDINEQLYRNTSTWPTILTGYLSRVNDATIALPKLADEEAFLNNKTFLYGGRTDLTRQAPSPSMLQNDNPSWTNRPVSGLCMVLGSGDTPPTKEDYKLENWIPTADLSVESYAGVGPYNEYPPTKMCSLTTTFRNNTEENITVKETGVCIAISKTNGFYPSDILSPKYILLVRDVLQNPVIIKPDEITSFTVVMK